MATVFDSHFAASAFPGLLDQFGESIKYMPRSGGTRTINAIVEREPPAVFDAAGNAVLPQFIVRVHNSCRSGISSNEIDTGGDTIELPKMVGDIVPTRFSIGQVMSQSGGVMRFTAV